MSEPTSQSVPEELNAPSRIPWPPIILIAVIAVAIGMDRTYPLTWPGMNDLPARVVGLAIGAGGVILALWAVWTMRRAQTTILPHKPASALVTSGPFMRLRNPIYVADIMILLGAAEITKNLWFVIAAVVFAILVTYLAILPEERHLEAKFGEAYRDYKSRSRRWL